jgi:hypothetical protein
MSDPQVPLQPGMRARFKPQANISAYELALIIEKLNLSASYAEWEGFPPDLRRHFIAPLRD